jgi:hypothetical protein
MTSDQLFTVPAKLPKRQAFIYELMRRPGYVFDWDALAAGIALHQSRGCKYCLIDMPCRYAASEGREVLEALRKKGLLKRDRHHIYRRAAEPAAISADESVDWGGY